MLASSSPSASLQKRTDNWFRRASAALLGQVPCRTGCSHCCIGPFAITGLDTLMLQEGLKQLPADERRDIEACASEQAALMERAFPALKHSPWLDSWSDQDIDRLVTQFQTTPCPALGEDGRCRLYEYRPLVCRSMGIPVEEGPRTQGACAVQTFVPIVRLSAAIRAEEQSLADQEGTVLKRWRMETGSEGDDIFVAYGFLADGTVKRQA